MSTPTPDDPTPPPPTTTTTTSTTSQQQQQQQPRLPVQTHHCRFCNHLLLATTRSIPSLPRRKDPAKDGALILPLPRDHSTTDDDEESNSTSQPSKKQKHYTILLSTTIPDRKHTLVRREDGFEKRLFLRCGRCRVVMGYFLDEVHFGGVSSAAAEEDGEGEGEKAREVVYLLPGALVETGVMMRDEELEKVVKGLDREWVGWLEG
ncbi:hypothetical protein BO85DRAFT_444462 [Aspergillus piperis CBS 112811]|uniref:STEEP1 domain-containing protein n=1 Tax=Aspergillus piperis CBS 112811 TaxID=1448313 RepID=A0A8G1RBG4_9EURO|nr:hypothetical protein BO85DRAFT_444462 [Aspergillus piperis CBS 112811]RAH63118.1 hypothetical protein BO85DRAFT_444462 [Aspergillus piperis CBS 112811]